MLMQRRIIHAIVCLSVFWVIHGNPFESVIGSLISAFVGATLIVGSYHFIIKQKKSSSVVNPSRA